MPQHRCAAIRRPLGNLVVVARDVHRQLAGRGDDAVGGPARECVALIGCEHRRKACLGVGERLHRQQHGVALRPFTVAS